MIHSTLWRGKQGGGKKKKKKKSFKPRFIKLPKEIIPPDPHIPWTQQVCKLKGNFKNLSASLTTGRLYTDPAIWEGSQFLVHHLKDSD